MHQGGSPLESRSEPVTVFVSVGSNLGERQKNVLAAIRALQDDQATLVAASGLYETEPTDLEDQPWFINAVAKLSTTRSPGALLELCQEIERSLGREKGVRFGPRVLDIDILLYGDDVVDTDDLTIPHPRMSERRFVLVPLAEIAPDLADPRTGEPFAQMLQRLDEGKKALRSAITES